MEERIVIAAYKPKEGQSEALKLLMKEHLSTLKSQNYVTDRASIIMEALDGTIIEVFEWVSAHAMQQAHSNPVVLEMWGKYAEVCDYIPVGNVAETSQLFSAFTPLN